MKFIHRNSCQNLIQYFHFLQHYSFFCRFDIIPLLQFRHYYSNPQEPIIGQFERFFACNLVYPIHQNSVVTLLFVCGDKSVIRDSFWIGSEFLTSSVTIQSFKSNCPLSCNRLNIYHLSRWFFGTSSKMAHHLSWCIGPHWQCTLYLCISLSCQ